nr:triphosphoribosyl-dephospho-CoA synthase [uncultured Carboxylicivirga sp.]
MQNAIQPNSIIKALLDAREERWQNKLSLAKHGWHVVSLQLNLPGYPKNNEATDLFVKMLDKQIVRFLKANVPGKYKEEKKSFIDKAGDCIFYLVPAKGVSSEQIKQLTETFEENHPLGRIIDLDVLDTKGKLISSGKEKKCFICDQSAHKCRKEQKHSIDEVRKCMLDGINEYLEQERMRNCIERFSNFSIKALLYEVSLTPKPGLVCRASTGAHSDMDFISFINSTAALTPYFTELGWLAVNSKNKEIVECFPLIREVGLKMENAMFEATGNINTHKGAIFLMALSMFSAVYVIQKKKKFKSGIFAGIIQQLTKGMIQRELCSIEEGSRLTHGESCFLHFGLKGSGARGEAEQGLPIVMHHALPFVKDADKSFEDISDKTLFETLIPILLKIMSVNNDTNILFRHGEEVLEQVKKRASLALEALKVGNTKEYYQLVDWCNTQKISPGGSADLLSVTMFVQFCQTDKGL